MAGYQVTPYEEVAGRDFSKPAQEKDEATKAYIAHTSAIRNEIESVSALLLALRDDRMADAAIFWFELSDEVKAALWLAPSKGGIFSTGERGIMKSTSFREAYYGKAGGEA